MKKIEVPKELEEQIVNLYVNKNYNRKQIKKKLNLPFGDSVLLRILKENNVEIRSNPGAKMGGRKKTFVDDEIVADVIRLYNDGYSLCRIVDTLKTPFGIDKVKSILLENNIALRDLATAKKTQKEVDLRKFKINDDYNLMSHNGAWILGFIAADGYLPIGRGSQNRIVITLARKDEDVLWKIAKELQYTGTIKQYESTDGFPCSSLNFTSKKLRQQIEKYGIGNNKTFKLFNLPDLPKEYLIDFIRGYFDGDGSVLEPKGKKINLSLVGASKPFLVNIVNFLSENYGVAIPTIHSLERVHTIYDIRYYTKDSFILGNLFYNNDYLALPRKKEHFLNIKKKYS